MPSSFSTVNDTVACEAHIASLTSDTFTPSLFAISLTDGSRLSCCRNNSLTFISEFSQNVFAKRVQDFLGVK